MITEAITR